MTPFLTSYGVLSIKDTEIGKQILEMGSDDDNIIQKLVWLQAFQAFFGFYNFFVSCWDGYYPFRKLWIVLGTIIFALSTIFNFIGVPMCTVVQTNRPTYLEELVELLKTRDEK